MKVLIADDHPLVRDALSRTLRVIDPQAEILEAEDATSACLAIAQGRPDLALLDLHMPGMGGADGVRRLRADFPHVTLVIASGETDPAVIRRALNAGAAAFLPKTEPPAVLLHVLKLVLSGGSYVPRSVLEHSPAPADSAPTTALDGLTPRQLDVLRLLMKGAPNKLIARNLGLTEGTVKVHIAVILRVLRAKNRTEAVVIARSMGREPPD